MRHSIRWGILGTGSIAHKFAEGLKAVPDGELVAVGSRSLLSANTFADEYGIPQRYGTYESLAAEADIDVVYVSTPHTLHCQNTLLCLNSGKSVLCEKPFAVNAVEAKTMIQCAREKNLFLMEAMWTRFIPAIIQVRQWLDEDVIGEVRMVLADFGFRAERNPEDRLFNPALAGGALMDIGVYEVSLASMILGQQPSHITAVADIGSTAVDEQTTMAFRYKTGALGAFSCAIRTNANNEASILGDDGRIRIQSPFWNSDRGDLIKSDGTTRSIEPDRSGNGYNYEASEVARCLRAGMLESPALPLDETLAIMQTLDTIRADINLVFPGEC